MAGANSFCFGLFQKGIKNFMKPHQFKIALTGSTTYDEIPLPDKIIRLSFKSVGEVALNVRFNENTGNPMVVPALSVWDSGFVEINSRLWEEPKVFVNGTGYIDGEYWR